MYGILIGNPLEKLFLLGPCRYWTPFWCGKQKAEICAILSKASVDLWKNNTEGCDAIIKAEIDAYGIVVLSVLHVYAVITGLRIVASATKHVVCWSIKEGALLLRHDLYWKHPASAATSAECEDLT